MTNKEMVESDLSMITALFRGGMVRESEKLLIQIYHDYKERLTIHHKKASVYLRFVLHPKISGIRPDRITSKDKFFIDLKAKETTWNEWISNFPGTSIESLEDYAGGSPVYWEKSRVDAEWFLERKAGLFYSVNGFNKDPKPGMKRRRTKGNVNSLNAVFIDLDQAPTDELKMKHLETIAGMSLSPSFVVETRNGFHALWLFKKPYDEVSVDRWTNIQKSLIDRFKSDSACSDCSRLLRMPSSWHCKDVWKGGEAFPVRIVYESPARYVFDDFKFWENKMAPKRKEMILTTGSVVAPAQASLSIGNRHAALKEEIARTYARLGTSTELIPEARRVLKDWYRNSCSELKGNWEQEVDQFCDWVEIEQFGTKML